MGSVPIVMMQPMRQFGLSLLRRLVGATVGPFAQRRLDKSFCLSVGARLVGLCSDVLEAKGGTGLGEGP